MGIGNAADPAYMIRDLTATDELYLIDTLVLEMGQWGPWYDQPKFLLDGKPVGDGKPGPVTRRVQRLYFEAMGADVAAVAPWTLG